PFVPSFPTRRSSELASRSPALAVRSRGSAAARWLGLRRTSHKAPPAAGLQRPAPVVGRREDLHRPKPLISAAFPVLRSPVLVVRSEEHTSELQSREN